MFMLFEYMFSIIFVIVFGMIIFQFVTGIRTWHKNNQSPRLSVSATIVAKRESITFIAMQMRVTCLELMAFIRLQVPATMSRFR